MGLFGGIIGNASEKDAKEINEALKQLLANSETVIKAYKLIRDMYVFTNKRIIIIDKQKMTGKKTEYHSIPYKNITHFAVETSGHVDLDSELRIWLSGLQEPIQITFTRGINIYEVQQIIVEYMS